jgi:phospholipid transport system substrate-binding protein
MRIPKAFRGHGAVRTKAGHRFLRVAGLAAVLATGGVIVGPVDPALASAPTEAVKGTIDQVMQILRNQKEMKDPAGAQSRRESLEKVVGGRFDYQEMSRRALGAHWNQLTDQEKEEFVRLFMTLLTNSYADRIENYSGEGVQYLNERTERDFAEVRTKVLSGKTEIPLDYRLLNKGGEWRVYDVVVDGVSLVSNYRGQFARILKSSSYSELVEQLRKKSDKLKAP